MTDDGNVDHNDRDDGLEDSARVAMTKTLYEIRIHGLVNGILDRLSDDVKCKYNVEVAPGITYREQIGFILETDLGLLPYDESAFDAFTAIMERMGGEQTVDEDRDLLAFLNEVNGFIASGVKPTDQRAQDCLRSLTALYGMKTGM